MSRKNIDEIDKEIENIKSASHSFITSIILFIVFILFFILFHFSNPQNRWFDGIFVASIIYLCFSIFWIIFRLGFGEKSLLYSHNLLKKRLFNRSKKQKKIHKITISEYRKFRSAKSWMGPILSVSVSSGLVIIAIILEVII